MLSAVNDVHRQFCPLSMLSTVNDVNDVNAVNHVKKPSPTTGVRSLAFCNAAYRRRISGQG